MTLVEHDKAIKALTGIEGVLEKHFGDGIFAPEEVKPVPRGSCGLEVVDYILGGGGIPRGRIIEVFGPEGTGKTSWAALAAATFQQNFESRVLYLDFEHKVDPSYLQAIGINMKRPHFVFAQPKTCEEGTFIAKLLLENNLIDFLVWDTPAASKPAAVVNRPITEKELREGYRDIDSGKSDTGQIGLESRVFSYCLAALTPLIASKEAVMVMPNQVRTTINTYGAGETTPGGKAPKFHASIRIRLSKKETTKESVADSFLGVKQQTATENKIEFHVVKNSTAPPFRKTVVRLAYGRGFLDKETLLDLAVKRKIIQKAGGGNFTLPGGKAIRGTENVLKHWEDNPADYDKLRMELRNTSPSDDEYEEGDVEDLPEGALEI